MPPKQSPHDRADAPQAPRREPANPPPLKTFSRAAVSGGIDTSLESMTSSEQGERTIPRLPCPHAGTLATGVRLFSAISVFCYSTRIRGVNLQGDTDSRHATILTWNPDKCPSPTNSGH